MVVNLNHHIKVRTDEWSELTVLIHLIEHLLGPNAESRTRRKDLALDPSSASPLSVRVELRPRKLSVILTKGI